MGQAKDLQAARKDIVGKYEALKKKSMELVHSLAEARELSTKVINELKQTIKGLKTDIQIAWFVGSVLGFVAGAFIMNYISGK